MAIILDYTSVPRYLWNGRKDQHWYRDCKETLIEIFGEDKLQLVCNLLAATSINSSLKSNLRLFDKAFHQYENGLPFTGYLPNIQDQLEKIAQGQELSGRKINNFSKAMAGDRNAVVCDIWILRAFGQDKQYVRKTGPHKNLARSGGASNSQYNAIENYIKENCLKSDLHPAEMTSMIWAGIRIEWTGKSNTTRYCEILKQYFSNKLFHYRTLNPMEHK